MKLALGQIDPTVGDLKSNAKKIIDFILEAKEKNASLVVFPELAVTGYPPEDLVLKPQFITDNLSSLQEIVRNCKAIAAYVGFVDRAGHDLYNAGAFIVDGKIKEIYHKMNLPNYAVFDEKRYFKEGKKVSVVNYQETKIGLGICEDIWAEGGPYLEEAKKGAELIININASPYHVGKIKEREKMLSSRAKATECHVVYVNMVGGQDELVFDGGSMAFDEKGKLIAAAKQYKEELLVFDLQAGGQVDPWLPELSEIYETLLLGIRDYVNKNSFRDVVIGISGGIDSALTLAIAADALGSSRVHAIFMPSDYTAQQSFDDAKKVAENLGVEMTVIPIKEVLSAYLSNLAPHFAGKPANIAEENLQARIRGNYLMALSNKFGWLVLATGNKSETSTGYCTLYGDMAGGFNALKDIPKTLVYKLVGWRNKNKTVIPESIIKRPPTAELKPDQKDQDTLPPYEILDPIINAYVEGNKSFKEIVKLGFSEETVKKVILMIDRSEYKRRQTPPGPRITSRAFGKDWRLPITNHYLVS
ncbi:MAG: NAD+ synthase [Candidatus Saganbacteria bacterium]|nr:NAD+ synthase [Candidatus Saganbacteria bacterium]